MHEPTYDDATLRRAFALISRPSWGTFEQALADELHGRVIRSIAWRLTHGQPMAVLAPPAKRPEVHAPWAPPAPLHQPERFDRKRAAAGDRDDA